MNVDIRKLLNRFASFHFIVDGTGQAIMNVHSNQLSWPTFTKLTLVLIFIGSLNAQANTFFPEEIPTLSNQTHTQVTVEETTLTVTFGPISLPAHHKGLLAATLPLHTFEIPKDLMVTGWKPAVFTSDGTLLPKKYLHHMVFLELEKPNFACPGEPYYFAASGQEMLDVSLPEGYGIELKKGAKIMTAVAFYHEVPPTKNVMASFTMKLSPNNNRLQPLQAYYIGVSFMCYSDFSGYEGSQTDEGILLPPGLQVHSKRFTFKMEGCVKFAYPHGHDHMTLLALDNTTTAQTQLRTVPHMGPSGTFLDFPLDQIYSDQTGFEINTQDTYEITMVYHRALQNHNPTYGMGSYALYAVPGSCEVHS